MQNNVLLTTKKEKLTVVKEMTVKKNFELLYTSHIHLQLPVCGTRSNNRQRSTDEVV